MNKQDISMTACLNVIELIVIKPKDPPKICLNLAAQGEIVIRAGSKLAIDVVICRASRDSKPVFTADQGNESSRRMQGGILYLDEDAKIKWTKELRGDADGDGKIDEGEYLPEEKIHEEHDKTRIDNAPDKTTMVLMRSDRNDSGLYRLYVSSEAGEDSCLFRITVIDRPSRPGRPEISELTGEDCQVDWTPPEDDGGCHIQGYIVERKKTSSSRWIKLNASLHEFHNYWARRMIEGNEYEIRVTAVNFVGPGEPSQASPKFTPQEATSEVTLFRTGEITDTSIELLWGPPLEIGFAGLDGYKLEYQKLAGSYRECDPCDLKKNWEDANKGKLINPDTLQINMENLETGKNYMFRICTVNAAGRSKWVYLGPILCAGSVIDPRLLIPKEMIICNHRLRYSLYNVVYNIVTSDVPLNCK